MVTRTLHLNDDVNALLDRIAESQKKTVDDVVSDMARKYDERARAVAEALADVAAGRVVDGDKMDEWLASWGQDDEKEPPACPD